MKMIHCGLLERFPQIINQEDSISMFCKPRGIWYAPDNEWADWCRENMPTQYESAYELEINYANILIIRSECHLHSFYNKYRKSKNKHSQSICWSIDSSPIDWIKVSKEYKGIEIIPYLSNLRLVFQWYYGWDVASGVIWDLSAIKSSRIIPIPNTTGI